MSTVHANEPVSTGWRAAFFALDFLLPVGGVFGHLFKPGASKCENLQRFLVLRLIRFLVVIEVLSGFTASPTLPPAVETQVLLDGMAGWFAGLAGIHVWLQLFQAKNKAAWKPVIAALVLVDIGMLVGFTRALVTEERLYNLSSWRNEDYSNIIGYTLITLARVAFVMKPSSAVAKDRKTL